MDAAGTNDTGNLGVHEGCVPTLSLGTGNGTMTGAVVVEELLGGIPARNRHCSATGNIAVHKEGAVPRQRSKLRKDVLAARNHLCRVIRRDVGREELGRPSLLDASPHGLDHLRDAFVHLTENLVALGLIVLDKVATLPECVAGLSEWFWLQAELWLDDGANDQSSVCHVPAENAPHVDDAAGWAIKEAQVGRREIYVIDLAVFNVTHALVVPDGQSQDGAHHCSAIRDVAIKEQSRIGNFHDLILWVNVVNESIGILGEVVRGADIHICPSGRLGSKMSSSCKVVVASLGFHDVGNKHMLAPFQKVFLGQGKICISAGLIQGTECGAATHSVPRDDSCKCCSRRFLLPVKRCSLDGRLPRVAELLLPARINLVRILLEREESSPM